MFYWFINVVLLLASNFYILNVIFEFTLSRFNPLQDNISFLYSLEMLQNLRLFNVFMGYRNVALA